MNARQWSKLFEPTRDFETGVLGPQGISERVLEALGQTERHRFIAGGSCSAAYEDEPVLIGHGQTISQPFIVALMTHLAAVKFDDTVLEVGTGSGYQAAVLARLVLADVENCLVSTLRRNDIVVMDNCRVHWGDRHWPGYRNSGRDTALPAEIFARPQSHRDALQQIQDIPA